MKLLNKTYGKVTYKKNKVTLACKKNATPSCVLSGLYLGSKTLLVKEANGRLGRNLAFSRKSVDFVGSLCYQPHGKKNKFMSTLAFRGWLSSLATPNSLLPSSGDLVNNPRSTNNPRSANNPRSLPVVNSVDYFIRLLSYQKLRRSLNDSILQFIVGIRWAPNTPFRPDQKAANILSRSPVTKGERARGPTLSRFAKEAERYRIKKSNFLKKPKRLVNPCYPIKKYLGIFSKWLKGKKSIRNGTQAKNEALGKEEKAWAFPASGRHVTKAPDALKGYYSSFIIKGYGKRAKRSKSLFLFKIGLRKQGGTLPKQIIPKSLFIKSKKKRTRFKFFTINKQVQKALFNKIIKLQGSSKKLPAFSYKDIGIRIFGKKVKKKVRRV